MSVKKNIKNKDRRKEKKKKEGKITSFVYKEAK